MTTLQDKTTTRYAVVDADGHFGGNKTHVYSTHATLSAARRNSRGNFQIIEGCLTKGEVVYGDSIGRIYSRV